MCKIVPPNSTSQSVANGLSLWLQRMIGRASKGSDGYKVIKVSGVKKKKERCGVVPANIQPQQLPHTLHLTAAFIIVNLVTAYLIYSRPSRNLWKHVLFFVREPDEPQKEYQSSFNPSSFSYIPSGLPNKLMYAWYWPAAATGDLAGPL